MKETRGDAGPTRLQRARGGHLRQGIRADNRKNASELAGKYKNDRTLLRARANAGLDVLRKHKLTDPERIAAIGYCFGGTAVLELARSGADLSGRRQLSRRARHAQFE